MEQAQTSPRFTTKRITYIGIFTALIIICSQISIPMPAGVPMTLQTLIIPLAGMILGPVDGTIATIVYLLLGAVGLPVFAGFKGGIGALVGMTGGFLLSFTVMPYLAGKFYEMNSRVMTATGLVLGAVINYAVGTVMFAALTQSSIGYAFTACVLPFIPTAILKIVIAFILGPMLRKSLVRAGVLNPTVP